MTGISVMEVVSGLGMGGAEKSFLSRINFLPDNFQTAVVNTRPELDSWKLPAGMKSVNCNRNNFGFLLHLHQELQNFSPDVVVVRSPVDLMAISLIKVLAKKNWKLVYEGHSVEISQNPIISKILKPVMRLAISQVDLTIAVSRTVADGPQCRGSKNLNVHHLGAIATVQQNSKRDLTFLFIARFVSLKQPLFLLEAIRLLADEFLGYRARVKLIGKGPLESEMVHFIAAHKLENIVEMCGYRDDLDSIYSGSEYLLSTSKFEGLPITFFEAKLHGLRIITTPSSGDFDILGSKDCVLQDFTLHSFVDALKCALEGGLLTKEDRTSIQNQNAWMQAESRAKVYYNLIETELTQVK
jgi:glycosyltransferase involved in cell wall biosynthesis